ncbi:hypothetical protein DIPPA_35761 [Diplonema papillatum]|nr:hypothetical protein DIPPA_35761 [Diplonema papillatum]
MSVACLSISRLVPLNRRSPLVVCSSVGYGLYLTAAPRIRAGLTWPSDKRPATPRRRSASSSRAQGDL